MSLQGDESTDYTGININKALILLSIPMVIEMVFESTFALVDAFFVSRFVGIDGLATIGLTESVLTIIYSIAWGISIGASAIISRKIGEKKPEHASAALMQVINISLFTGVLLAIIGFANSYWILKTMQASDSILQKGIWYTKIQFLSSPVIILLFSLGGALRGAGNASKAMKVMIIANIINIFFDLIFIPLLHFGVEGAALATLIGRTTGVIIQFLYLFSGKHNLKLKLSNWHLDWKMIGEILWISSGSAGQFIIQSASWVFLIRILSGYGSEVVGGYTIAMRLISFTMLPSWGLANAASALVGQNLGASKPDRASKSAWRAGYINMIVLGMVALFYMVFASGLVGWFSTDQQAIKSAILCLQILCSGYIFYGLGMVMTQGINGAGDTMVPTLMNIICFWCIEIPLAYFMANYIDLGATGVYWSIVISESILAILAMIYFKSGRWKLKTINV